MKATKTIAAGQEAHTAATVVLTIAQRRHLTRLIRAAEAAEMAIKEAERNRDVAIANANGYVGYLAEEHGVPLGQEGWLFDQDEYRFVQQGAAGSRLLAASPENSNGNE